MTIFFSSHILNEVQMFCKRVAIIKEGRIMQIEDIETLRKKQLRKVSIESGDLLIKNNIIINGLERVITRHDNSITFLYSGDINELLRMLAQKNLINMTIEEPSLEEIFMHYYR